MKVGLGNKDTGLQPFYTNVYTTNVYTANVYTTNVYTTNVYPYSVQSCMPCCSYAQLMGRHICSYWLVLAGVVYSYRFCVL